MRTVQTSSIDTDILRNLGTIAADERALKRVSKYLRRVAKEVSDDSARMMKKDFFEKLDRAEQQIARGEGMTMLPGEDLTAFLKRNGYDI
jgi:hypothetical protein